MTLNDLKEEICSLGFESEIEIGKGLLFAVRRALATIYNERGVYKSLCVYQNPERPNLLFKRLRHTAGSVETYELSGSAFSFTVSGIGGFSIEENGTKTIHNFDTQFHVWKGFINTGANISFFGELCFDVFDLTTFKERRYRSEEDIPVYGEPIEYRISDTVTDFLSFCELPRDESGGFIDGAALSADRMIIPYSYEGKIRLTYKSAPPAVNLDEPDRELSISKEIEHLVPLLSGAYYWLDDDEEKAQYYLSLYSSALSAVKKQSTRRLGGGYENVTGWA